MRRIINYCAKLAGFLIPAFAFSYPVIINEFVVDPKQDRNGDGLITGSDEFFELKNSSNQEINLENWSLELIDTTPEYNALEGIIPANGYFVIENPRGAQNDSGEIRIIDNSGNLINSVIYGNWPGSRVFDGDSRDKYDESMSRHPDGSTNWVRTYSTPGGRNEFGEKLRLFVERNGQNGQGSIRTYTTGVVNLAFIVQRTADLQNWRNIYTNPPKQLLEFQTSINTGSGFYRAVESEN